MQPIAEIARITREAGVPLHVDGVQALGKIPVDVERAGRRSLQHERPQALCSQGRGRAVRAQGNRASRRSHSAGITSGTGARAPRTCPASRPWARRRTGRAHAWPPSASAWPRCATAWKTAVLDRIPAPASTARAGTARPTPATSYFDGIDGEALVIALDLRGFAVSTGSACSSGAIDAVARAHRHGALRRPRARQPALFAGPREHAPSRWTRWWRRWPPRSRTCAGFRCMPEPPIAVAMSGGVDSSTVAALLARQGHAVIGLTMQLWNQRRLPDLAVEGATGRCCSLDDVYDARRVAEQIGIPYYVVNFEREFEEQRGEAVRRRVPGRPHAHPVHAVQQLHQVRRGFWRWPMPWARTRSPPAITRASAATPLPAATSCCARVDRVQGPDLFPVRPHPGAACAHAVSAGRDSPSPRSANWRAIMGLAVAEKSDSQEICFVPNGDYAAFLTRVFEGEGRRRRRHARRDRLDRWPRAGRARGRPPFHRGPAPRPGHRRRRAALRDLDRRRARSASWWAAMTICCARGFFARRRELDLH